MTKDQREHYHLCWGSRKPKARFREALGVLGLGERLKPARNKALAHNDLETLMADTALGSFPEGADVEYFAALQALVNEVHQKWVGGPYPFSDLAQNNVREFLGLLERVCVPGQGVNSR